MSREWASVLADRYESGELKWTKGTMVSNWIGDESIPCHCVTGAIALDCGAEAVKRSCSCEADDCTYGRFRFLNSNFRMDPRWTERITDLGKWILEVDPYGTASPCDDHEDVIVNMNDDGFKSVADAIETLRQFAADE